MLALGELESHPLALDAYIIRANPARGTVLVATGRDRSALGYDRLVEIDLTGATVGEVAFPRAGHEFPIYNWYVSRRGVSYLFSSDELAYGLEVDAAAGVAREFLLPRALPELSQLYWFGPEFSVLDFGGGVWRLQGDCLVQADQSTQRGTEAQTYRALMRHSIVTRCDHERSGYYVVARCVTRRRARKMGYVRMGAEPAWFTGGGVDALVAAVYERGGMLLCSSVRITSARSGGGEVLLGRAAAGTCYRGAERVCVGGRSHVVLLRAAYDESAEVRAFLDCYPLRADGADGP